MSVRVNRNELTESQIETIRKYLYMQPKSSGFFKNKRYATPKDPILMWYLDKPNNEVVIPYTFANVLFKRNINASKSYPESVYNFTGTLRPHQIPIVLQAVEQLNTHGTTTLGVYPGCGKTIMSACLGSKCNGLVLVVYPIKMVEGSWVNTFKDYTDAAIWHNDGKSEMPSSCNVIISMDTQFHKIPKPILNMVKVLILDEAHMFCVPSRISCLLGVFPQYIIACTATLQRTDGMEQIIYSVCGKHGIFLKSEKPFEIYKLETGIVTEICKNATGDTDWPKLVRDLCEDPVRNAMIINLVERNHDHKIMILTWNKAHAHYLKNTLVERGVSTDILVGNKNTYHDSRVLVAGFKKAGTGFDEAQSCPDWGGQRSNMMILAGSTKSLTGLDQFIGRVFRADFPVIIDLVDNNRISKSHWTQRKKLYEDPERNGVIHTIVMKKGNDPNDPNAITQEEPAELNQQQIVAMQQKSVARLKARLNIVNKNNNN